MKKCTDTVVDWMMRYNVIHDEDKELYKYALHSVLLFVSPFILAGSIGFFVGSVKHGILLILPFIVLRKFSGGYHAKNLSTCILESGFLLFVFSPIDSENRRVDIDERGTYKKLTVFFVILFGVLDVTLFLAGKKIYTICFSVGVLMTASLQIPCIVKKICKLTKNRL